MKLSNHFNLEEFTVSQTAKRRGIRNKASAIVISNLAGLCKHVLEPIRESFGPVIVSSGYRSPKLNKAIGGSATSQHCKGQAADIFVPGFDNKDVAKWIKSLLTFDQLILEFYPGGWIHVSYVDYTKSNNRHMVLRVIKKNGRTKYLKGL